MLHLLLILLLLLVTASRAATTNTMASVGASVAGNIPYYTDTSGQLLAPLGTAFYTGAILTPWVDTNNNLALQWRKPPQIWEFIGAAGEWTAMTVNSGTTSQTATAPDTAEDGVWSASTGTLTNGLAGFRGTATALALGTNELAVMWRIRTPANLSTDAEGYELYAGIGDGVSDAEPTDGAYFYYLHSVSNGVWTAKTANNSVRTFATGAPTTPPTVAVDTWYNLLVAGNATVVNFWVSSNDGATWQFIGTSTSNLPITTARSTGIETYVRKVGGSVGTAARVMYAGRCTFWAKWAN